MHREVDDLLRDYAENLARRGIDLEGAGLDWQRLGEQAKPQAERRVQARLLLDAICEAEKIEVGEEEFEQALALLARAQGIADAGAPRSAWTRPDSSAGLRSQMRREKTRAPPARGRRGGGRGRTGARPAHDHEHVHEHKSWRTRTC